MHGIFAGKPFLTLAAVALALTTSSVTQAAGRHDGQHGKGHATKIGEPGNPAEATRSIEIDMLDNSFTPTRLDIRKGETVRFILRNVGEAVHEFNIGTAQMHVAHRKEMLMMMENGVLEVDRVNHHRMKMDMGSGGPMVHDDPNSKLLEPGKSAEIVWKFNSDTKLEFACNVPGHYESGMKGDIRIR